MHRPSSKASVTFDLSRGLVRWHASMALILKRKGDLTGAAENACKALIEARKEHSGLRYHPNVGLVGQNTMKSKLNWQNYATYNTSHNLTRGTGAVARRSALLLPLHFMVLFPPPSHPTHQFHLT